MKTIPDYSVIQFKNHNILCVGGAVSIDRTLRKQQMDENRIKYRTIRESFWENEAAVFNESKLLELFANYKIDTVVTHTAPSFCYPTGKRGIESWLNIDKPLEQDLTDERAVMDRIYVWLKEKGHTVMEWFYGHFHDSSIEYISGTKFTLLNIDKLKGLI
ncbi:MAG: hypothetical protein LIO79_08040 [Rikenellaceae bacterium]|nr:hypothetical protein [Rikenellaceae bacterium]